MSDPKKSSLAPKCQFRETFFYWILMKSDKNIVPKSKSTQYYNITQYSLKFNEKISKGFEQ